MSDGVTVVIIVTGVTVVVVEAVVASRTESVIVFAVVKMASVIFVKLAIFDVSFLHNTIISTTVEFSFLIQTVKHLCLVLGGFFDLFSTFFFEWLALFEVRFKLDISSF